MIKSNRLYQNPMSRFAGVMALAVFIIAATLLMLDYFGVKLNPIIGMLTYTLFPGLLFFYLILIPVGMYREWRRRHRQIGVEAPRYPRFDFNDKHQRNLLYFFIVGTSLVGLLVLAISYRVYEFTDTVHFCADLCHKVMEPEATTYKASPHTRVACMKCHVGEGATWYVKSKLSGMYQVYATLFNKYPRPIETPVENLRPSRDTCEQCHWPTKFVGAKQVVRTHYEENEGNSPRQLYMLMNVGGGISPTGIHWHVGQDEVYYISKDKARQEIPWVKVKYKDGREVIYSDGSMEQPKGELRKMDCIDCHNRPTHVFKSPKEAMDEALADGRISASLPYIKKVGVELLSKPESISDGINKFYGEKYPKVPKETLEKTISALEQIYNANNFPHMRSNWSVYPNNIGHMTWPGCFRCHDDNHKNDKGESIKKDCNICHIFLSEKFGSIIKAETMLGRPFQHPVDIGGEEKRTPCNMCHAGK